MNHQETLQNIERLKVDLSAAVNEGVQTGDLEKANLLKDQIDTYLAEVRHDLMPFPSYLVDVDYDQPVERLVQSHQFIERANNKFITSQNFRSIESGQQTLRIYLFNFQFKSINSNLITTEYHFGFGSNKGVKGPNVISYMSQVGLRPATVKELLALFASDPDLGTTEIVDIAALGSTWLNSYGDNQVVIWEASSQENRLILGFLNNLWGEHNYFAAVKK